MATGDGDGLSSSSSSSLDDVAVGTGLVTGLPSAPTVLVVPSAEVTVEVEVSGVGVGAASETDNELKEWQRPWLSLPGTKSGGRAKAA